MPSAPKYVGGPCPLAISRPLAIFRRLAGHTALAVAIVGDLSGCVAVSGAQPDGGRAQLVSDLASRLTRSGTLTYTAVYRLPQGASATIAQDRNPNRDAYTYPGGKLVLTPDSTADCRTTGPSTVCTLTAPPSPDADPAGSLVTEIATRGLIPPIMVIGLLTAAALESGAVVTADDTTIAGENATCVHIKGMQNAAASAFDVCVTTDGLLGSFSGTVSGAQVDVSLDRYDQTVTPTAFDLPAGARIVDQRPRK